MSMAAVKQFFDKVETDFDTYRDWDVCGGDQLATCPGSFGYFLYGRISVLSKTMRTAHATIA